MVAWWWHLSERKECAMKDVCLLMLLYVLFLGSVKTAIPTLGSGSTMATNNTLNTVNKTKGPLHTTTTQAPGSLSSQEAVVAAQRDEGVGEADDKPVRLSTTLIVALSVASVLVVIVMVPVTMFVIFLHQRKQRR